MEDERETQILELIERLTSDIRLVRGCSFAHTAHLLEMAKLDLMTKIYAISDDELLSFTTAIQDCLSR